MKRLLIGLAMAVTIASAAWAGQVQVAYQGSGYGPYQTGSGGEFTLTVLQGSLDLSSYGAQAKNVKDTNGKSTTGTFQTFCLEGSEYIYPYPAIYDVTKNTKAVSGGGGFDASSTGDPLSVGTGWLYSQFASGTWVPGLSYNYDNSKRSGFVDTDPSKDSSADLLQRAIWWLEGEEGIPYNAGNIYMKAVVDEFGVTTDIKGQTVYKAMYAGAEIYGVYALNLSARSNAYDPSQDQLYYHVPDGGSTIMLLGLAIAGVSLISRRFRA